MKLAIDILKERISAAMAAVTSQKDCAAIVKPSTDPKFGDYQANGVMALAKKLKTDPKKLAGQVVKELDISDICEPPEIAGPGFINLRLKSDFIAGRLLEVNKDHKRLSIEKVGQPRTIVIDFSGPNIAKDMHVGHLRSTIIGDCIRRLLNFQNHKAIWQNHFGDWGTNFGMVILGLWHICTAKKHGEPLYYHTELKELKNCAEDKRKLNVLCRQILKRHETDWIEDSKDNLGDGEVSFYPFLKKLQESTPNYLWPELLVVYKYINALEDSATGMGLMIQTRDGPKCYESLSSHVTYMLQRCDKKKDDQELRAWDLIRKLTLKHCNEIYKMLGIDFDENTELRGESAYKEDLPKVVEELKNEGIAKESDGAVCIFPEGFKNKEGEPLPFIIQKSDGAYLYATTDLAALRYRVNELKADRIIYVTDARQKLHFEMLFAVARMANWVKDETELIHVTFGSVLGENGKPLKTREGENVKLKELLDEAVQRAEKIVEEKNPELSADKKAQIAQAVGIGAVKYADFSNNRTSDYVFSFNKMLAMDGNTAPYMQYAYARIKSIERKAQTRDVDVETELSDLKKEIENRKSKIVNLNEPAELDLAKQLIRYGEAIQDSIADYKPNYITAYLYELAQKFSVFYTNCPVLDAGPDKRPTRLLLCDLTAKTIKHGLTELLGIEVVEQM